MKYSIIIPVYGVEKYIRKCLDSILNQSYHNFEVIIVNDGTKDNSQKIIDEFVNKDKRFKTFIKKNGGLSDTRNYGVTKISKDIDYILFIDSDDYIENDLLETVNSVLSKSFVDALKYACQYVDEEYKIIQKQTLVEFNDLNGIDALSLLIKDPIYMTAWSYVYKKDFWISNNFLYPKGRIHEDSFLTPYVLAKADKVSSINYIGYNYLQRDNSIMGDKNPEKIKKSLFDMLINMEELLAKFNELDIAKEKILILSDNFAKDLYYLPLRYEKNNTKEYLKLLKKKKMYKYFNKNGIKIKIEILMIIVNINLYIWFLRRRINNN